MKTTLLLLLAAAMAALAPTSVRARDDIHVSYEEGRAAFNAGQYDIAREKLSYVLSKAPDHLPTRAMLAQIEAQLGPDNTILRKSYEKIILDRVEFADVSLDEALQAIRMLALKASQNKVVPNVIVKDPEAGKKTLTLNLARVPLSEVLSYLAQLTNSRLVYDKTAVLITSFTDVPRAPATATPNPITSIPGIVPSPPIQPPPTPMTKQHRGLDRHGVVSSFDPFAPKS